MSRQKITDQMLHDASAMLWQKKVAEEEANLEPHDFSPEFETRMEALLRGDTAPENKEPDTNARKMKNRRIARRILATAAVILIVLFAWRAFDTRSPWSGKESSEPVNTYTGPHVFGSLEEFERFQKENRAEKDPDHYYVPDLTGAGFSLIDVRKKDDVYIMTQYQCSVPSDLTKDLSDYDAERLTTLICRQSLYGDPEASLKTNFIDKGYQEIRFEGKTYYRWDEHAGGTDSGRVIGYEIAFMEDGSLIFMHLPAYDSFEEMMKYTKLIRRDI